MDPLAALARNGPRVLVAGLVTGLAIPPELNAVQDHIAPMVVVLLFLSVLRVDPRALLGPLRDLPKMVGSVLALQLAFPLAVVLIGGAFGWSHAPLVLALTLVAAAPAIVGSPNICVMVGVAPTHALRLLIVGTILLPLTVIPVFWASSHLDGASEVLFASLTLLTTLGVTIGVAIATRLILLTDTSPKTIQRLDGISAVALALFVIGLMPDIRETALNDPLHAAVWLIAAFAVNWGAQVCTFGFLRHRFDSGTGVATAIYAGNRNVALFLVALPEDVTESILVFVGCYQFPMYLTPMFMGRLYRRWAAQG